VEARPDVPHGDVSPAQRGTRQTRGDDADLRLAAVREVDDHRALARGGALLDREPDAALREGAGWGGQLRQDDGRAVEVGPGRVVAAAVLADEPAERGHGRRVRGRDVLAVQAHAGLEAEGVACREAREADLVRFGEEELRDLSGQGGNVVGGDGDLEPVLAGVSRAGDEETRGRFPVGQGEAQGPALAEVERAQVRVDGDFTLRVDEGLEDRSGCGTLKGEQGPVVENVPGDAVCALGGLQFVDLLLQEGQVLLPAAGVGDEVERVFAQTGDDRVVDDAAGALLEQAGQRRGVVGQLVEG